MSDEILLARLKKVRDDPWEFLKCVRTQDQVDRNKPVKPFPVHLEYLELYVKLWLRENLLAIPKSRRMKMSWTNIALYTWDTMFHFGRHTAFVSKKEEDSADLVERAKFIYENLDPDVLPRDILPKLKASENMLEFPELGSKLQGFPSGSDQLRQFTFSGMLFDEMAFWTKAREAYSAAIPTLEGGGRGTCISSAGPGFFQQIVFDQIDKGSSAAFDSDMLSDQKPTKRLFPMKGIEIWKNPKNNFCVIEIHYTADPAKRSEEWKKRVKSALPLRDWLREYEINWETWEGLPVYADWNTETHGSTETMHPHLGLPLLRGWDFGLTPAAVVCQYRGEELVVLKEFVAFNMGIERFSTHVLAQCAIDYPLWNDLKRDWVDFIDPSGFARKDTDEKSCADILASKKLRLIPGPIAFTKRKEAVEHFLTKRTKEGPCFRASLPDCPMLVRGFKGGYQYPEEAENFEANELRPEKNEFSHVHDALQMVAGGIRNPKKSSGASIPTPSYSAKG